MPDDRQACLTIIEQALRAAAADPGRLTRDSQVVSLEIPVSGLFFVKN